MDNAPVNEVEHQVESREASSPSRVGKAVVLVLLLLTTAVLLLWWEVHRIQVQLSRGEIRAVAEEAVVSSLQGTVQTLASQNAQPTHSWVFARVDYLLQMADYSLRFSQDVNAATKLLVLADRQIKQLNEPDFRDVQRRIHSDIAALEALPDTDIGALLARIEGLRQQLKSLPIMPLTHQAVEKKADKVAEVKADEAVSNLHPVLIKLKRWGVDLWHMVFDGVKGAVIVRYHDDPIQPLLPPDQQVQLLRNIDLKLSQVGWAALHHRADLYQADLSQIVAWIRAHYQSDQQLVGHFLAGIEVLQQYPLNPSLPDVGATLGLFREVAAQLGQEPVVRTVQPPAQVNKLNKPKKMPQPVDGQPAGPHTNEV